MSSIYQDFPDYILKITREIWEDRGIATLHQHYAPDLLVRTPGGITFGNQQVIASTMATLHEFPDRQLFGEDVIWSGTPEAGMLSSHRIISTATHSGSGVFGAATGKPLRYRIIADCHARNDVIDDEWMIRDQGAIVRQLGMEPETFARLQIEREQSTGKAQAVFTPDIDQPGPYTGTGNDNTWGHTYADILTRLMGADFATVTREYDRACQLEYPGARHGLSHADADQFWMGLRASFPNAEFRIHHQIGRDDEMMPPRAALRWSLQGTHDGWGSFGPPSGATVHVMGACHAEFGPWGLRREYALFDETAIWKQIVLKTG